MTVKTSTPKKKVVREVKRLRVAANQASRARCGQFRCGQARCGQFRCGQ